MDYDKLLQKANDMIHKYNLIPTGYYNPLDDRKFYEAGMNIYCSTRSVGKTTGFLIVGLCMFQLNGSQTVYMRAHSDMTKPKNTRLIFNVIIDNKYIEKITDGKYNNVYNYSRYWYLCNINEDGEMVEKAADPFMIMMGLDEADVLTSNLTLPDCRWVIFDEFISHTGKYVAKNAGGEFYLMADLLKSILRDRLDAHVCMLSNTVDIESKYFYELEIRELIEYATEDETEIYTTELGTKISYRVMTAGKSLTPMKHASFLRFFGFKNPQMAAITGIGSLFAFPNYPHLEAEVDGIEYLCRNIFCEYMRSKYLQIEFVYVKESERTLLHIHKCNKPWRDDAVVLVAGTPRAANEVTWSSKLGRKILKMREEGLATYGTNSDGSLFTKVINAPKLEQR